MALSGLALALLALAAPPPRVLPSPADLPARGIARAHVVVARAEPSDTGFSLERLDRGAEIRILDVDPATGWLTIEPPASAFGWVDAAAVEIVGEGRGRVARAVTELRAAIPDARIPGPPLARLRRGDALILLPRPPLATTSGASWLAVQPPAGGVRYVRADQVDWIRPTRTANTPELDYVPERRVSYEEGPPNALDRVPAEFAAEIARAEAEHRAVLSGPVESWRLEGVKQHYTRLLERAPDPVSKAAVTARLDLVARHAEMAKASRTIQTLLERSRRRDHEVSTALRTLAGLENPQRRPFVAEGLMQPSSRMVQGRRVYALIGPDGVPLAYLDVPPGLDARPAVARRVGVRGAVRYDESLRSRLIAVHDLEPLEK